MELKDKVTQLKGVGPKKAQALEKLNIRTLEDMVFFLPRDYEDRRNRLRIGQAGGRYDRSRGSSCYHDSPRRIQAWREDCCGFW